MIGASDSTDWYSYVPLEEQPHVLLSVVRKIDASVYGAIDAFMRGELDGAHTLLGLGSEGYELGTRAAALEGFGDRLDEIEAAIVNGTIEPPLVPTDRPLPPPGFDPSLARGTVTVGEDGHCDHEYEGPEPSLGLDVVYEIEDRSDFEILFGGGDLDKNPGWDITAGPRSATSYFIRLTDLVAYALSCVIDPYGPDPQWQLVTTLDVSS